MGGTGGFSPHRGSFAPPSRRGILVFFVGAGQITYWQERKLIYLRRL